MFGFTFLDGSSLITIGCILNSKASILILCCSSISPRNCLHSCSENGGSKGTLEVHFFLIHITFSKSSVFSFSCLKLLVIITLSLDLLWLPLCCSIRAAFTKDIFLACCCLFWYRRRINSSWYLSAEAETWTCWGLSSCWVMFELAGSLSRKKCWAATSLIFFQKCITTMKYHRSLKSFVTPNFIDSLYTIKFQNNNNNHIIIIISLIYDLKFTIITYLIAIYVTSIYS